VVAGAVEAVEGMGTPENAITDKNANDTIQKSRQ
jgi:hypothetical protein